ncbi:MAG: hydrolase, partial [Solirubrobacteraceae bacterium]
MSEPRLITAVGEVPPSLARVEAPTREPFRVGLVQEAWHADAEAHAAAIERGIAMAAGEGAQLVCLQELTLSSYFAIVP